MVKFNCPTSPPPPTPIGQFNLHLFFSLKTQEYLKNKKQREEALQKYKQKKMETFQMLSKKTKKGQPNLNLQMEYLLQKIQGPGK